MHIIALFEKAFWVFPPDPPTPPPPLPLLSRGMAAAIVVPCERKGCRAENWEPCGQCEKAFCKQHLEPAQHDCGHEGEPERKPSASAAATGMTTATTSSFTLPGFSSTIPMRAATASATLTPTHAKAVQKVQKTLPFSSFIPPPSPLARRRAVTGSSPSTSASLHASRQPTTPTTPVSASSGDAHRGKGAGAEQQPAEGESSTDSDDPDVEEVSAEKRQCLSAKSTPSTTSGKRKPGIHVGRKGKTVKERANDPEFKKNGFIDSNGSLFCVPCSQVFTTIKSSTLKDHYRSASHTDSVLRRQKERVRQQRIELELDKIDSKVPMDTRLRRVEVVRALMHEGIALHSLRSNSPLRAVLESGSKNLGGSPDLAKLIPIIAADEQRIVVSELTMSPAAGGKDASVEPTVKPKYRPFSVIFDGTTSVAEVFCVAVRFVTDDGYLQQRVLALRHYKHSLDANEHCHALCDIIMGDPLNADAKAVLAFISDRAAVNVAALGRLQPTFFFAEAIGCLSHTISNAAKRLENDNTAFTFQFVSRWINIIGRSQMARALFKERTSGITAKRANLTRWFAEWEVIEQLGVLWGDVGPFLQQLAAAGIAAENVRGALELLGNHHDTICLQISAIIDVGRPLCQGCYQLEGDEFLAIRAYDKMMVLEEMQAPNLPMPNCDAMISTIVQKHAEVTGGAMPMADRTALRTTLKTQASVCVRPAIDYLVDRFASTAANGLRRVKDLFEACRLCDPCRINQIAPDTVGTLLQRFKGGVFGLDTIYASKGDAIGSLVAELTAYRGAVAHVAEDTDAMMFWRQHYITLPNWARLSYKVALFQPSSATAERVFSMLEALFNDTQTLALEDLRNASIQMRYNELQREALMKMRLE